VGAVVFVVQAPVLGLVGPVELAFGIPGALVFVVCLR
jgi:hypothetical protein